VLRHFYVVLVVSTVPKKKKLFAGTSQNFIPSTHVHTEVRRTYVRLAAKRYNRLRSSLYKKKILFNKKKTEAMIHDEPMLSLHQVLQTIQQNTFLLQDQQYAALQR
jgi:hypothetical protein